MVDEMKSSKEILDLSSGYVVMGSGLNAVATVHGLLDNRIDKNKKIYVIDAGITDGNILKNYTNKIKMPSPKFRTRNFL
tara:strand:+ start:1205 stop:1441 length:237 start_codon:yes stop_codon:yes gene_type:complete